MLIVTDFAPLTERTEFVMTLEVSLALLLNNEDRSIFIGILDGGDAKAFAIKLWFFMILFTKYE